MLSNAPVHPTLAAKDYERAKKFYKDTLGLPLKEDAEEGATFEAGKGTYLFVYPSSYAGTNQATSAEFTVDDIDAVMKDLRSKGVTFEEYDFPGLKTVNGVAEWDGIKSAWFKDTEGNILALTQQG